ncbi:MAG: type III ribulose-bisphosphate carboxylase [archaeon]
MTKKYSGYVQLGYKPSKDDLVVLYRVKPAKGISMEQASEAVAAESSIGTWTEVATMSPKIQKMSAKVFDMRGQFIKIAYPLELFEPGNMPQIWSSIAGNIFNMKDVECLRLEDAHWPEKIVKSFRGPKFGIPGIRKMLGVKTRPLCGTIVKPKLGLNEKEHAKTAYEAWMGGIDIVKDDENLTSQPFNHFQKRVIETLKLKEKAEKETGEKKVYMPNVSAETKEMLKRADFVRKQGGDSLYMMVDILTVGWAGLQTLREENEKLNLVMHAHRAMHGALTRNKEHGISMLFIADTVRMIGVDQLHIGTAVGKMMETKEEVRMVGEEIEQGFVKARGHRLQEDWHGVKPVFAVCSGGLHPGLVPPLVKNLGKDIIVQCGGGVHGHPGGTRAGAKALRQSINAIMAGKSLSDYGKTHKELGIAIKKWGSAK